MEEFNKRAQLKQILERQRQYPGSSMGGTGLTGLEKNDAQGWSRLQNENTWAMNALRGLRGLAPMNVQADYGGTAFAAGPTGLHKLYQQAAKEGWQVGDFQKAANAATTGLATANDEAYNYQKQRRSDILKKRKV